MLFLLGCKHDDVVGTANTTVDSSDSLFSESAVAEQEDGLNDVKPTFPRDIMGKFWNAFGGGLNCAALKATQDVSEESCSSACAIGLSFTPLSSMTPSRSRPTNRTDTAVAWPGPDDGVVGLSSFVTVTPSAA